MIVDYNQMPADVWKIIVSYRSENALARVSTKLNKLLLQDLIRIKTVYDEFLNLRNFFLYDDQTFFITEFSGELCKNNFNVTQIGRFHTENCTIDVVLYDVEKITPDNVSQPIKKIHVTKHNNLNEEQHLVLERAEKFANMFYHSQLNKIEPSSLKSSSLLHYCGFNL